MALTVSGPNDLDLTLPSHYGSGAALSRAVTEAERGGLAEASYYVRRDGEVVGRVDRERSRTFVRSKEAIDRGAEDANLEGEPARARATGSASEASSTRRPGPRAAITPKKEEPKVAAARKTKTASRKRSSAKTRTAARPPRAATAPRTAQAAAAAVVEGRPEEARRGEVLYEALLAQVREAVAGVEVKPNKSGTYARLLTKSGKAFAYIFPPRKGGVALKIPKQLLEVERELPEGHGFKKTGWGLTRTVKSEQETPVVAKALAVAATAVTK